MNNNSNRKDQRVLTTKEAAALLKVGIQTIKNYIYHGKIKSFKTPGGHHRILESELPKQLEKTFVAELKNGTEQFDNKNNSYKKLLKLNEVYLLTIKTLLNLLEKRDTFGPGHSQRVSNYAKSIARSLKLSQEEISDLELASLLHDIGKSNIEEEILSKPKKLSSEEFSIIKRHPEIGEEIVKDIQHLDKMAPIIRHHHERIDGHGYPDGLANKEIPLASRIISVAETFDSLTSPSNYRQAMDKNTALKELIRVSGKQLDSEIVELFIKISKT